MVAANNAPEQLTGRQWQMHEISLHSATALRNPFIDVEVWARVSTPNGRIWHIPAFYDGDGTWRIRFTPDDPGTWQATTHTNPSEPMLERAQQLHVEPVTGPGFLRAYPGEHWGFRYDDGTPAFLLGDTMYHIFAAAHCGIDPRPVLERRRQQGYNLFRARLSVSPYHPPYCHNQFEGRSYWAWGGSPQHPEFDQLNLPYFQTVDRVIKLADELGFAIEMILEGWLFEFPYNARNRFTAEHEEFWVRYLVARYDAFRAVAMWTTANEYIYYPDGIYRNNDILPDRWAARLARIIRLAGPHGHPIAVHTNGDPMPTFAERLARYPDIDVILYQNWGRRDEEYAWLATGIDAGIAKQCRGARQVCVLSEYGYERNPGMTTLPPSHTFMNPDHTRRGAWRSAFMGLFVFAGFDNTWGPIFTVEPDCAGAAQLQHLHTYLTAIAPFTELRPADLAGVRGGQPSLDGSEPLCLAADRSLLAVYLPAGGRLGLTGALAGDAMAWWYDPRTGEQQPATAEGDAAERDVDDQLWYIPPSGADRHDDWVLTLRRATAIG